MNPTISIIMPIYNVEPYIKQACDSIRTHWREGLQVVLVDDGSTDRSMEIATWALSGLNVVAIAQQNQGLSVARNVGIKAATGDYLLFLDSDDYLLSMPILTNEIAYYCPCVVSSNNKQKYSYYDAWSYVVKRQFVLKHKLFFESGKLCESVRWVTELRKRTKPMVLTRPLIYYRHLRAGSIMNTPNPQRIIDLNETIRDYRTPRLLLQSWYYIHEYTLFEKQHRKSIANSYHQLYPKLLLYPTSKALLLVKRLKNR